MRGQKQEKCIQNMMLHVFSTDVTNLLALFIVLPREATVGDKSPSPAALYSQSDLHLVSRHAVC